MRFTLSSLILFVLVFCSSAYSIFADTDSYQLYDVNLGENLGKEYVPEDLVPFSDFGIKTSSNSNTQEKTGRKIMMNDLKALIDVCETETGLSVYIRSGYRSYGLQTHTYGKYGSTFSAQPGKSEHQLGLAIDIETHKTKGASFMDESNPIYTCFMNHAGDYGFVQTYPKGNPHDIGVEPWHWRFLGKEATAILKNHNALSSPWLLSSFEEYSELVRSNNIEKSLVDKERELTLKQKVLEITRNAKRQELEKRGVDFTEYSYMYESNSLAN